MRPLSSLPQPASGAACIARVADLRNSAVPHWRLYASDLTRPIRGVVAYPGVDPAAFDTKVRALRLVLRPGMFISRRTAAALYGAPVAERELLDVGAVRPKRPLSRKLIRPHQVLPGVLRFQPSPPDWLPSPADTWALLAATADVDELVAVGDYLVSGGSRRAAPLCRVEELSDAALRFTGCVGARRMHSALPLVRTGVESPAETRLRLLIVRAGVPEPQTCCPVTVAGRILHADLGYPEWNIALEYDGAYHFTDGVSQARKDNERIEAMHDAGWRVLRVTVLDLRDPGPFLARLRRAIAAAERD